MDKQKISGVFKQAKLSASKHKPEILMVIGIGCMVTSTVTAVKATPKAMQLLEAKKEELETDELTPIETVTATWKCYIPTVVSGVVGISCLVGSNSVSAKRSAALATAYKLSETAFAEYKDKVVETIGEKKEKTVRDKVNKEKLESEPVRKSEVIVTGKGETECYDVMCGRRFRSDIDKIKKAENVINERMLRSGYISLNDFYDEIGLPTTELGEVLGWNTDDGLVKLYFGSYLVDDSIPVLTVEFEKAPRYDYYKFS